MKPLIMNIPLDTLLSQNPANWRHLIVIRQIRDNADMLNPKKKNKENETDK